MADTNVNTTYTIYQIEVDKTLTNDGLNVDLPNLVGYQYNIRLRWHETTSNWLFKLKATTPTNTIDCGWRRIICSPCINFEYQNVLPMGLGFHTYTKFTPIEQSDLDKDTSYFYIYDWEDLEKIVAD